MASQNGSSEWHWMAWFSLYHCDKNCQGGGTPLNGLTALFIMWRFVYIPWKCYEAAVDWLIDWLTLGLRPYGPDAPRPYLERPFLPHNLTSAQGSPVPFLKFWMDPRLKILITSGSKKDPRYTFLFSQKSQQMNPPSPRFPKQGPYEERGPVTGHMHISQKPHISSSPIKEPSLKVPLMESLAERLPTTRALLHWSIKVPGIWAPPHTKFPSASGCSSGSV